MASTPQHARHTSHPFTPAILLAFWRLRQSLAMLCITGIGLMAAVLLVCTIPLYSQVNSISGLHALLNATPQSSTITLHIALAATSNKTRADIEQRFQTLARQSGLVSYLTDNGTFSVKAWPGLPITGLPEKQTGTTKLLSLQSYDLHSAAQHLHLLDGHLPAKNGAVPEILVPQQTARLLNLHVGSMLTVTLAGYNGAPDNSKRQLIQQDVGLQVAGIYTPSRKDPFWHGDTGDPTTFTPDQQSSQTVVSAIIDTTTLFTRIDTLLQDAGQSLGQKPDMLYSSPINTCYWYYQINSKTLSDTQLSGLQQSLRAFKQVIDANYKIEQLLPEYPYIMSADLGGEAVTTDYTIGTLDRFSNRLATAQIPITFLMIEAIALILFFVAMMAGLLIERQAEALAVLGSRGASKGQIFSSILVQSVLVSLFALIGGLLLAFPLVSLLAWKTFGSSGQEALMVVVNHLWQTLGALLLYGIAAVLVGLLTIAGATYRVVGYDILSLRRQSARDQTRPYWQRLNLDIVAIVIALAGYGISLYLTRIQNLDEQTHDLVVAPLTLIAPLFLAVAVVLLLLRIYPFLLRILSRIVSYGRGVSAVLALGQMARSPGQSLRLTLLLSLTSAFAIFALVFTSSQAQQATAAANYSIGADFMGKLPVYTTQAQAQAARQQLASLPDIASVTTGYTASINVIGGDDPDNPPPLEVRAVDADTFARTAIWPTNNSTIPLNTLMRQLMQQRTKTKNTGVVPVIVDQLMVQRFNLAPGDTFSIQAGPQSNKNDGTMTCLVMAVVQHIPTVGDALTSATANTPGGILADYQSYAAAYQKTFNQFLPPNTVWLHATSDAAAVGHIHQALTNPALHISGLQDRLALARALQKDPFYLNLLGELAVGATMALFLALLGSLLSSWLSIRMRLTSFATLRALGSSLQHIATIITWEQSITYLIALLLGLAMGAFLSATVTPTLVVSSVSADSLLTIPGANVVNDIQHIIPAQIVVPTTLALVAAILSGIFALVLAVIVYSATHPAISSRLRINDD